MCVRKLLEGVWFQIKFRSRKLAQQHTLTLLDLVPSIHMKWLITAVTPAPEDLTSLASSATRPIVFMFSFFLNKKLLDASNEHYTGNTQNIADIASLLIKTRKISNENAQNCNP